MSNKAEELEAPDQSVTARLIVVGLSAVAIALVVAIVTSSALAASRIGKPTIVMVQGELAGSPSWNSAAARLIASGYPVLAITNPARGVRSYESYLADVLGTVKGPVILVGQWSGPAPDPSVDHVDDGDDL